MLMVTAPLHWPPASNLGSCCIRPVHACRHHPPESRGAVERSCIYEGEVLYSSMSNLVSLRFLHVSLILTAHLQLQSSPPKALVSGRELVREEVMLPHKPWREGEVVENTTVLLQHWPQALLPGSCVCKEDMPDGIHRRSGSHSCPQFQVNSLVPLPFSIPVSLCRHMGKTNSCS